MSTVTVRKVSALYEQLMSTAGPSSVTRKRAATRGWALPVDWDDIDDPNGQPEVRRQRGAQRVVRAVRQRDMPVDRLITEVARLTAADKKAWQIAEELGVSERTVVRARSRFRATEDSEHAQASHEAA